MRGTNPTQENKLLVRIGKAAGIGLTIMFVFGMPAVSVIMTKALALND